MNARDAGGPSSGLDAAGPGGPGARAFVPLPLPAPSEPGAPAVGGLVPRRRLAEAVDAVAAWLPMLLMALVALGTWWLVKSTPLFEAGRGPAPAPRHEPDATMNGFRVQRFAPDGRLRVEIEGEQMRHYPDTDTYEIDTARLRSLGADGRTTRASAARALANRDASEVQLSGGAHVVQEATATEAAIDFRGEFLDLFQATEQVRSHLPVVVVQGADELHADGMVYDHLARVLVLRGRVRAVMAPPGQRAGGASSPPRAVPLSLPLPAPRRSAGEAR